MQLRWCIALGLIGALGCVEDGTSGEAPGEVADAGAGDRGGADAAGEDAAVDPCAMVECGSTEVCRAGACIAPDAPPEIDLSPASLDFGRVPAGVQETLTVTVTNLGSAPLQIDAVRIDGDAAFSVETDALPMQLDGGVDTQWTITYTAAAAPAHGTLIVESNDPAQPAARLELSANGAGPCVVVTPEALPFGAALIGRTTVRPVRVESCGGAPVQVTAVHLADGSAPHFTLADESPAPPFELAAARPDAPLAGQDVLIAFAPDDDTERSATLILETSDPARPTVEVPLSGRGSMNACPVAVVGAELIDAEPLDIIALDGSGSSDPDGPAERPVQYTWTVIEQPEGSTSAPFERFQDPERPADTGIPDDTATPRALFYADVAGVYTLELTVTDNLDLTAPSAACPQPSARVRIEALPDADVHVQLTWNTPDDPDQTDGDGTDLDLHLRHPDGAGWGQAPLDCYYDNVNPDWGPDGPEGNPMMVLDDVNGAGPEIITLNAPEATADGPHYRIGVEYYRAENFVSGGTWGASEATVVVLLRGMPAAQFVRVMESSGDFWEVADVVWGEAERRVDAVDLFVPGGD